MNSAANSRQLTKLGDKVFVDLKCVIGFQLQPDLSPSAAGISPSHIDTKIPMFCVVWTTNGTMGIFGNEAETAFEILRQALTTMDQSQLSQSSQAHD